MVWKVVHTQGTFSTNQPKPTIDTELGYLTWDKEDGKKIILRTLSDIKYIEEV